MHLRGLLIAFGFGVGEMVEGWEPRDNREGMSVLGVIRPVAEGGEHIHDFGIRHRSRW